MHLLIKKKRLLNLLKSKLRSLNNHNNSKPVSHRPSKDNLLIPLKDLFCKIKLINWSQIRKRRIKNQLLKLLHKSLLDLMERRFNSMKSLSSPKLPQLLNNKSRSNNRNLSSSNSNQSNNSKLNSKRLLRIINLKSSQLSLQLRQNHKKKLNQHNLWPIVQKQSQSLQSLRCYKAQKISVSWLQLTILCKRVKNLSTISCQRTTEISLMLLMLLNLIRF